MFPFPLRVETPDGRSITPVKASECGPGEAVVHAWDESGAVEVVTGPYTIVGRNVWRVMGEDGAYLLTKGPGCGCGHPLKSFRASLPERHYVRFDEMVPA